MKKLVFTLICLLPVFSSQARIITVDDNGLADFDNIQDAIYSSENGDTIIVRAGTYNQGIVFDGKAVTLTSEDPDDPNVVQSTIITSNSRYSVDFEFGEGNNSVLTGFTITGGEAIIGAGIHCSAGTSPTISKNVIEECGGNGIRGDEVNAEPIISDNKIRYNAGYGIKYCNGPITYNTISENKTGGLVYCHGEISNNRILNNVFNGSPGGGGLTSCQGEIIGNLIAYNYTNHRGGACYECNGNIVSNRIIGNTSQAAGGALSNCSGIITNNIIAGNKSSSSGGGLFFCYQIYNNTIVGNIAEESGGALSRCQGYVRNNIIAYNSANSFGGIYGTCFNSYNAFWLNNGGNFGDGATKDPSDINDDPFFVSNGYWDNKGTPDESDDSWVDGDYHVTSEAGRWSPDDQSWVNDNLTSPCIDAGGEPNDPNSNWTAELWPHGKRINMGAYGGTIEASMSLSDAGNIADLNPDVNDANDWVGYDDMLLLTEKWLSNDVPLAEDLNRNGIVDFADYAILVSNWQPKIFPPQPPLPSPMTWATEPQATSRTAIEMAATIAASTDNSGVEYYFKNVSPGGHDSGWQENPNYTDTGLTADTAYSYKVKARNIANLAETDYSEPRSATTLPPDTTPPSPNPATWETEPNSISPSSISMVATTASDESGVEYFFACTSNTAYSSNWQEYPVYQLTFLPRTTYSFIVRVRDKSPNRNTTGDSPEVTVDLRPPTPEPDPMIWATKPQAISRTAIEMEATTATSTDESSVQYYFQNVSLGGHDSGWQEDPIYKDTGLTAGTAYSYKVKARNTANLAETDYSGLGSVTTFPPDTTAPSPNPATWQTEPYLIPPSSIRMVATTASDESGVEYRFICISHPAFNSGWQDSPVYQPTSLPKDIYRFIVIVRDKSPNQNTTGDSSEVTVDIQPPSPDPMQWAEGGEPREVYGGGGTWDYYAEMTAAEATDASGGVEYYFLCTTRSDFSRDWSTSPYYKVLVGRTGQAHRFRVKARDINKNETAYSPLLPTQ